MNTDVKAKRKTETIILKTDSKRTAEGSKQQSMIEGKSDLDDLSKVTQSRRSPYNHTTKKEPKKAHVAFGRGTSNTGGVTRQSATSSMSNNNDHQLRKFS